MASKSYRPGDKVRVKKLDGEWQLTNPGANPRTWVLFPMSTDALAMTPNGIRIRSDYKYTPYATGGGDLYAVTVPSSALERVW